MVRTMEFCLAVFTAFFVAKDYDANHELVPRIVWDAAFANSGLWEASDAEDSDSDMSEEEPPTKPPRPAPRRPPPPPPR